MFADLRAALPRLIPKAIEWAEAQSAIIAKIGRPLDDTGLLLAASVGVAKPGLIRLAEVPALPPPDDPELRRASMVIGLFGPHMIGMTFGYGIYVCRGQVTKRLLAHEFRHVFQYEQAGSIAAFLPVYMMQIASVGYEDAPLEIDARAHESGER